MIVVVMGTAGSGKTMLVSAFSNWLVSYGQLPKIVNLDPGAEDLPFKANYDVRENVSASYLMRTEGLGPNGAIIRASSLMVEAMDRIMARIKESTGTPSEITLVDTPGQMELLVFHASGPALIRALSRLDKSVGVFLLDPQLIADPISLASALTQAIAARVRLDIPLVLVVSKCDLKLREDFDKLVSQAGYLKAKIREEGTGSSKGVALSLAELLEEMPWVQRIVKVSSLRGDGFSELYDLLRETFCACGDLT